MLATKLKEAAGNGADATLYVDDVFSTWLYTGNGATRTITNGIDLAGKGGLVWRKARSSAEANLLTDTVNGGTKYLISNTTAAQATSANNITSFNSDGFSMGTVVNTTGTTYASWTFREAAKFFDVVTYTGNGTINRVLSHSLGVAPGMVIVKICSSNGSWAVRHRSATGELILDLTSAQDAGGFYTVTAMDASTFTVSVNGSAGNESGQSYVAYLYAHDTSSTGIIQCGSFTTDGSGNTTVNLGWEPQYLMVKNTSTNSDWYIVDSMRGFTTEGSVDKYLFANNSLVEDSSSIFSPTATGFKIAGWWSSATVIYMAIRRPNKPPTSGTQVFSPIVSSAAAGTKLTTNFTVDAQIFTARGSGGYSRPAVNRLIGVSTNDTDSGKNLYTNTTSAEASDNITRGWDNTGFKMCASFSGANTIFWNFARAPGFFDEVCYTGTGVATTQAHNLGVVPELMIVKQRSAAGNSWVVYSSAVGNTKYMMLNSTIGAFTDDAWNNTTPTSSLFTISGLNSVNQSATTFVTYLFATLAGISKVGSYTGNGTGQAIACGFSAGARFVLIKRTDSTGGWYTFDSARGLTVGSSPYLLLNSDAAEVTGDNGVYASTGGFTLGATAITTTNIATATYIFLAVS